MSTILLFMLCRSFSKKGLQIYAKKEHREGMSSIKGHLLTDTRQATFMCVHSYICVCDVNFTIS